MSDRAEKPDIRRLKLAKFRGKLYLGRYRRINKLNN